MEYYTTQSPVTFPTQSCSRDQLIEVYSAKHLKDRSPIWAKRLPLFSSSAGAQAKKSGGGCLQDSALRSAAGVANGIDDASNDPGGTKNSCGSRVLETVDEQGTKERRLVLDKVGVGTLG